MKQAGQIVLAPFPYTDLSGTKLRPVLMLRQASRFDDWLVCMVSSKIDQAEEGFDEVLGPADADFAASGLKVPSVLRLSRLAVLDASVLVGAALEASAMSGWPESTSGSASGSPAQIDTRHRHLTGAFQQDMSRLLSCFTAFWVRIHRA